MVSNARTLIFVFLLIFSQFLFAEKLCIEKGTKKILSKYEFMTQRIYCDRSFIDIIFDEKEKTGIAGANLEYFEFVEVLSCPVFSNSKEYYFDNEKIIEYEVIKSTK